MPKRVMYTRLIIQLEDYGQCVLDSIRIVLLLQRASSSAYPPSGPVRKTFRSSRLCHDWRCLALSTAPFLAFNVDWLLVTSKKREERVR